MAPLRIENIKKNQIRRNRKNYPFLTTYSKLYDEYQISKVQGNEINYLNSHSWISIIQMITINITCILQA